MRDLKDINELLNTAPSQSIAFQSVLVTSLQVLDSIHRQEVITNDAALSLGQRFKMQQTISSTEALQEQLQKALNKQGAQIRALQKKGSGHETAFPCISWWDCIDSTIETLATGIECIGSMIKGQSKDSPARNLGTLVKDVLSEQYKDLLIETEEQLV